jgi:hypothetical protein
MWHRENVMHWLYRLVMGKCHTIAFDEWMNEWINEWTNERTNERTNKRTNERTNVCTYVRTYVCMYVCMHAFHCAAKTLLLNSLYTGWCRGNILDQCFSNFLLAAPCCLWKITKDKGYHPVAPRPIVAGPLCTTFSSVRHLQRRSTSYDMRDLY